MCELGYFTLPVGQDPKMSQPYICIFQALVDKVLQTADPEGTYQLYQCVIDGVSQRNIVPVCRVHKPLLISVPRVYLDTSAVSYLLQEDSPERMAVTREFWKAVKEDKFFVYLSDITLDELYRCPEPKRTVLFDFLQQVHYTQVTAMECPGIDGIVQSIRDLGIFPKRSEADILHVAVAIYTQSDVIASWNFKHLTNKVTVERVRSLTVSQYNSHIDILTPEKIMEVYL